MTIIKKNLPQAILELFENGQILQLIAVTNKDKVVCYIFPGDDQETQGISDEDLYDFTSSDQAKEYKSIDPTFVTGYCCQNNRMWCVMNIDGTTVKRNTKKICPSGLPPC